MSARTCQLCGKPLSRWAGSDGDFCSREHRNQYRLRQGMGRLQEANKVASVMRRREQLRTLSNARLANPSNITPRGFFIARPGPPSKPQLRTVRIRIHRPPQRIAAPPNRFIPPRAVTRKAATAPNAAMSVPFAAPRTPVVATWRSIELQAQMVQAPMATLRISLPPRKSKRRDSQMPIVARKNMFPGCRTIANPAARLMKDGNPRTGKVAPALGKTMRVSFVCSFRRRPTQHRFATIESSMAATLSWREKAQKLRASAPNVAAARCANGIAMPPGSVLVPGAPPPAQAGLRKSREAARLRMSAHSNGERSARHAAPGPWIPQTDYMAFPEVILSDRRSGRLAAGSAIQAAPSAVNGHGTHKQLLAPFVPQEVSCGLSLNVNQNGSKDQKR